MPKKADAKQVGSSNLNGIPVNLFELKAKTGEKDNKTEFTYQFPKFNRENLTPEQLFKALEYTNSKKEVIAGFQVALDYIESAIKSEKRASKLAEINGVLKLREDPEKAIQEMIDSLVIGMGVPRQLAEANVRALVAKGNLPAPK